MNQGIVKRLDISNEAREIIHSLAEDSNYMERWKSIQNSDSVDLKLNYSNYFSNQSIDIMLNLFLNVNLSLDL